MYSNNAHLTKIVINNEKVYMYEWKNTHILLMAYIYIYIAYNSTTTIYTKYKNYIVHMTTKQHNGDEKNRRRWEAQEAKGKKAAKEDAKETRANETNY